MKTEKKKTEAIDALDENLALQLVNAGLRLKGDQEVTHRKWLKMTSDQRFGPGLHLIMAEAFRRAPFTVLTTGGLPSFLGQGSYHDVVRPDRMGISIEVVRADQAMKGLKPFHVYYCSKLNEVLQCRFGYGGLRFKNLNRQFWLVKPGRGASLLELPLDIPGGGDTVVTSAHCLGDVRELHPIWDAPDVDQLVVILTGGSVLPNAGNYFRLDLTVVKPLKATEDSQ